MLDDSYKVLVRRGFDLALRFWGRRRFSVQCYWWTFIFLLVLEDLAENFLYCYTFANFIPAKTLQELYISLIFMTPYCYGP